MSKSKIKKEEEKRVGQPYAIDKFATIKPITKILFLKFWVAGLSYFLAFMTMELANRIDILDQLVAMLLILILMTEYITNKIITFMHRADQPTIQYLPYSSTVNRKSMTSLMYTILYCLVLITAIYFIHQGVLYILDLLGWWSLTFILQGVQHGMDPITMGLYFIALDYIWITVKEYIVKKRQKKATDK